MFYHLFPGDWRKYSDVGSGLWIILLEAGLALALLGFIVWWTLPKKPKNGHDDSQQP
jgi:plastocyanin domain-containing protein